MQRCQFRNGKQKKTAESKKVMEAINSKFWGEDYGGCKKKMSEKIV